MQHYDQIYSQEFQLIPDPDFGQISSLGHFFLLKCRERRPTRSYLGVEKWRKGSVHICRAKLLNSCCDNSQGVEIGQDRVGKKFISPKIPIVFKPVNLHFQFVTFQILKYLKLVKFLNLTKFIILQNFHSSAIFHFPKTSVYDFLISQIKFPNISRFLNWKILYLSSFKILWNLSFPKFQLFSNCIKLNFFPSKFNYLI